VLTGFSETNNTYIIIIIIISISELSCAGYKIKKKIIGYIVGALQLSA